jgi:hypothetical protein
MRKSDGPDDPNQIVKTGICAERGYAETGMISIIPIPHRDDHKKPFAKARRHPWRPGRPPVALGRGKNPTIILEFVRI